MKIAREPRDHERWSWGSQWVPISEGRTMVIYGAAWRDWLVARDDWLGGLFACDDESANLVANVGRRRYWVIHLPSGDLIASFDRMALAHHFCKRIDGLADWSRADALTADEPLTPASLRRIVLDLAGDLSGSGVIREDKNEAATRRLSTISPGDAVRLIRETEQ